MRFEATPVTPQTLLQEVQKLADRKYRFVTMSQTVMDENTLRLYYHFDENLTMTDLRMNANSCLWSPDAQDTMGMVHLRMDVDKNEPIPSISSIYGCALLIENETQDQFGVHFSGLPLDFQGGLYLEGEVSRAPFFTMTTARKPVKSKADKGEQA